MCSSVGVAEFVLGFEGVRRGWWCWEWLRECEPDCDCCECERWWEKARDMPSVSLPCWE